MPLYTYKAIDPRGKRVFGRIDAANLLDLEQRLGKTGLDLVTGAPSSKTSRFIGRSGIRRQDLINFCFHMEQLTAAGVPVVEGLADLRDSAENPRFREVASGLIESIEGGKSVSQALDDYPEIFSKVFVSLVRSGEQTGRLVEVLKSLTESLKWEDELAAHTKKLMVYPAFVGSIVVLVTFPHRRFVILRELLVGHTRRADRRLVRDALRREVQPQHRVRDRSLQDLDATDRTDPAQDHPVPVRFELRHDVRVGDHRDRRHPFVRADRRQPSARRRVAHRRTADYRG